MNEFEINGLDHVAIKVKDMEVSCTWYENNLGLKKYKLEKWGDFPIFMLSGKSGVAIFPVENDELKELPDFKVRIDHFAFNLSKENFAKAKEHFDRIELEYIFKDHFYYHSIYLKDPDSHVVELTALIVNEEDFY